MPGMPRRRGTISQSSSVRSCLREWTSERTTNWKISPRPVDSGAICGVGIDAGRSFLACSMRSNTNWRANHGSVSSRKMIVIAEMSARDTERSSTIPGTPLSAFSIGKVTLRSTSRADRPGASVRTETWMPEMSGIASIGRLRAATTPPASNRARSTSIM
jgi:hypothetical protein